MLKQKFGDNCGHRRFDDMVHGFSSAQANFSDPVIVGMLLKSLTLLEISFLEILMILIIFNLAFPLY